MIEKRRQKNQRYLSSLQGEMQQEQLQQDFDIEIHGNQQQPHSTNNYPQPPKGSQSPQQQPLYRTSITQLISQPAHDNPYSMQTIYQSLYELSDYLWNKKLLNKYGGRTDGQTENNNGQDTNELSFDGYLLPIKEELLTYQRFRKNRVKEMQKYEGINDGGKDIVSNNVSNNNNNNVSNTKNPIKHSNATTSLQSQLIKCYQQVPFIYFQEQFTLDFSNFYSKQFKSKFSNTQQMRQQQQKMNDQLDLIEINLFGQIHKKFQDYFKAAANFDYLQESIVLQLDKLNQARQRVKRVNKEFVEKSSLLRKKIIQRNNYQKTLKKLKLMRSLRKLPQIIQTILQSSLPYQCLQLLNTTRSSITQVKHITSICSTIQNIKSAQTLVQLGLNKRYTDQLYLYVQQQVFTGIDFVQQFKKIVKQHRLLQQRDNLNSSNMSGMNDNSMISNSSSSRRVSDMSVSHNTSRINTNTNSINNRSGIMFLDQLAQSRLQLQSQNNANQQQQQHEYLLKNIYCKRQQAKEYEIAMILLQSYDYLDFPVQVTRIKLTNGLRVVAKRFEKELLKHVKMEVLKVNDDSSIHNNNKSGLTQTSNSSYHSNSQPMNFNSQPMNFMTTLNTTSTTTQQQQSPQQTRQLFNKVSVSSYTRHIKTLNQMFKQTINRYLGYVLTLVTQYEEKLHKDIVQIGSKSLTNPNGLNKKQLSSYSQNSIENLSQNTIKSQSSINNLTNTINENNQLSLTKMQSLQQKSKKLSKLQASHTKFKSIFTQQLTLLPSIFKIIEQKVKYFLTLKNMSNASPQQFYEWVGLVRYWQRWFDTLVQDSVLLNYTCTYFSDSNGVSTKANNNQQQLNSNSNNNTSSMTQLFSLGQDMVQQLISIILQNIKKSISTMNIKNLITQLTISYINSYAGVIKTQLNQAILQQSWQSVEIPQQFSQILQNILTKPCENHNMSLTILNSSSTQMSTSFIDRKDYSTYQQSSQPYVNVNNMSSFNNGNNNNSATSSSKFKFKILKNNILLQGQRYKLTMSFLLLCQFLEQMIKVGRLFQTITGQTDQQSIKQSKYIKFILSHLYQKIYQLIDSFNLTTKEMILQKKALKMEKIKGNNIAVKHICLLSNCLTFLQKLTVQIPQKQLSIMINKKQHQLQTISGLNNHDTLLIDKISSILNKKMQQIIQSFKNKQQQKTFSLVSLHQFITQSNQSIVTLFLQITQIIDEYLDVDKCERILKGPFQLFVQKYFKIIILKGDKFAQQARLLLEKMKFLKKYFKNQFVIMQRQVQNE